MGDLVLEGQGPSRPWGSGCLLQCRPELFPILSVVSVIVFKAQIIILALTVIILLRQKPPSQKKMGKKISKMG